MNGWMFFPAEKSGNGDQGFEVIFGSFPGMHQLSGEEWRTYIPESKERLQGKSLGFYCGGGTGKVSPAEVPPYPMKAFRSNLMIMALCWTYKAVLTVTPAPDLGYKLIRPHSFRFVLTVTGTYADNPPSYHVYGSYSFFPPPYKLAKR